VAEMKRERENRAFTPLFGLNGDVSPDRVWVFWPRCPEFVLATVLNRVGTRPKQGMVAC